MSAIQTISRHAYNNLTDGLRFITIPGIGTPPVDQWRQGNTGPHWVRELSKDGLFYKWEHGLSANSSLSWQAISTSAIELLDGVIGLRKSLGKSCGPVMFLAHSLGGSILKQVIQLLLVVADGPED